MERYWYGRRGQHWLAMFALILFTSQPLHAEEEKSSSWAVLNGRNISEGDLATFNNGQTARTMHNQVYQARKQALDAYITDQLIEQEAKKRGIARDQLVKQEVDDKTLATSAPLFGSRNSPGGSAPEAMLKLIGDAPVTVGTFGKTG